jgi:hypothetical protein
MGRTGGWRARGPGRSRDIPTTAFYAMGKPEALCMRADALRPRPQEPGGLHPPRTGKADTAHRARLTQPPARGLSAEKAAVPLFLRVGPSWS